MNKKLLTIVIFIVVIIILGVIIYLVLPKNQPSTEGTDTDNTVTTEIPALPDKIDTASIPAEPVDLVLAEVTVTAQSDDTLQISLDKIRDYVKYPKSTEEPIKTYDNISVRFNGWINTVQNVSLMCPEGFTKKPISQAIQEGDAQELDNCNTQQVVIGKSYLAKLSGCFGNIEGYTCPGGKTGWSAFLYSSCQKVEEYECVENNMINPSVTPPPINLSPK